MTRVRVRIPSASFSMADVNRAYFEENGDLVPTQIVNKKGFRQTVWQAAKDVGGAAKDVGARGLEKTASVAAKGVDLASEGIARGGMTIAKGADMTDRLAGAIRRNPKTAGAILLGGAVVGAGGAAYAANRRKK